MIGGLENMQPDMLPGSQTELLIFQGKTSNPGGTSFSCFVRRNQDENFLPPDSSSSLQGMMASWQK